MKERWGRVHSSAKDTIPIQSRNQRGLTIPGINPCVPLELIIHKSSFVGIPAIIHHLPLSVTIAVRVEVAGVASWVAVVGEAWHFLLFSEGLA